MTRVVHKERMGLGTGGGDWTLVVVEEWRGLDTGRGGGVERTGREEVDWTRVVVEERKGNEQGLLW